MFLVEVVECDHLSAVLRSREAGSKHQSRIAASNERTINDRSNT